ncbi:hypothetical protein MNB_ARC-1_24 [hydrothermal vent metagenome]|uniref:Uncharacterized protein n=1 Tax=hydrothermal vent metagenome TaxID=652676 RepID=A0A3B1E6W1_9ZZZZ
MKKQDFLDDIKLNCSEILYLSSKHILDKLYKDDESINCDFFVNYKNYHIYLNDYAGIIYGRYASSVDRLYIEMCNHLDIEIDNKYTLEHVIAKLEKQTPELLLGLTNEDIQKQTIIYFDEKLVSICHSTYYKNNIDEFKQRVQRLEENILLVKSALKY